MRIILLFLLLLLAPAACNVAVILAPSASMLEQQTGPMALSIALISFLALIDHGIIFKQIKQVIVISMSVLILYGNITQTLVDQEAMRQGKIAAENISKGIVATLSIRGMYDPHKYYAVIGSVNKSPLFYPSQIYGRANTYAKTAGDWWGVGGEQLNEYSWMGIYRHLLNINLPLCATEDYIRLSNSEEYQNMPLFPAEGSIIEVDGIILIKVS